MHSASIIDLKILPLALELKTVLPRSEGCILHPGVSSGFLTTKRFCRSLGHGCRVKCGFASIGVQTQQLEMWYPPQDTPRAVKEGRHAAVSPKRGDPELRGHPASWGASPNSQSSCGRAAFSPVGDAQGFPFWSTCCSHALTQGR